MHQYMNEEHKLLHEALKDDWRSILWDESDEFTVVKKIRGDKRRWSTNVQVITRCPSGQLYEWNYEDGHTEYQEDDYHSEVPIPVEEHKETVQVEKITYKNMHWIACV